MSKAVPVAAPRRVAPPRRRRPRDAGTASAALAAAVLCAAALAAFAPTTWLAACGSPATLVVASPTPGVTSPGAPSTGVTASSPAAVVTTGPVPAGAVRAAARYWRLIDQHRYAGLLAVVTPDSTCAAAVRGDAAAAFFGIDRVRVVSYVRQVDPAPPALTTLEFTMTVDIQPGPASAWSAGDALVFMCLRYTDGRWLVYEAGSGP
jgi:hypothetical protein